MESNHGINDLQKMIFIYNTLESGWTVRKINEGKYDFIILTET